MLVAVSRVPLTNFGQRGRMDRENGSDMYMSNSRLELSSNTAEVQSSSNDYPRFLQTFLASSSGRGGHAVETCLIPSTVSFDLKQIFIITQTLIHLDHPEPHSITLCCMCCWTHWQEQTKPYIFMNPNRERQETHSTKGCADPFSFRGGTQQRLMLQEGLCFAVGGGLRRQGFRV